MTLRDTAGLWHQLVLLWINDAARFQEYLTVMAPIVSRYGGTADRVFAPTAIHAEGLSVPDVVNFVHYDSRSAFDAFKSDPDFLRIKHLRDESVDLVSVDGRLVLANPAPPDAQRVYGIEVVRFHGGSREAYSRYEVEGESVMARYGFQVEHLLDVATTDSVDRRFDLVKISSFPSDADRSAFGTDPMHRHVERELYPAAVADVIWVDATLRATAGVP